mmetsp:Transcript_61351/g.176563  ORF Transcript_61351/g.176563 Transcript_61351/m.176563 type:complete len:268 (+) Transcript_61351:44-847(+)
MLPFCRAIAWQCVMFRVQQALAHCLHGGRSQSGYLQRLPESAVALAALVVASQRVSLRPLSVTVSNLAASASACSRACCNLIKASEHRASQPGFLSGWMRSARRRYAFRISWPFVAAETSMPKIAKGRSAGVARIFSAAGRSRGAAAGTPGGADTDATGTSATLGRFGGGAPFDVAPGAAPAGAAAEGAGGSSSSSSMVTGSSRSLAAASPPARIAPRTASSTTASKTRNSCHVWSMRTTSRRSCSFCAFLKVATATGCTLSASSAL